jgi:hypothetical protein
LLLPALPPSFPVRETSRGIVTVQMVDVEGVNLEPWQTARWLLNASGGLCLPLVPRSRFAQILRRILAELERILAI